CYFPPATPRPPPSSLFPYTTLFRSAKMFRVRVFVIASPKNESGFIFFVIEGKSSAVKMIIEPFANHKIAGGKCRVFYRNILQAQDRKSTRLNSSHVKISYAVFCLKK